MGFEADVNLFEARLYDAIKDTMEKEIADAAKKEILAQLGQYSFPHSRGPNGMGLLDSRTLKETVEQTGDTISLTVESTALFQKDKGQPGHLAEVVTRGDAAYHMPGPRPFMAPAQDALDPQFEQLLAAGLEKRGFGGVMGAIEIVP